MGEAKRRKHLGLVPRREPVKVREVTLEIPRDLADRLVKLCPPEYELRQWLVGALGAFADWAEQEQRRQDSPLVLPATKMPNPAMFTGYTGKRARL